MLGGPAERGRPLAGAFPKALRAAAVAGGCSGVIGGERSPGLRPLCPWNCRAKERSPALSALLRLPLRPAFPGKTLVAGSS